MIAPATYTASIVRMNTQYRVPQEYIDAAKVDAIENGRMDMAFALAAFLAKQFITEHKTPTGIDLRLNLDLLIADEKVPAGLAHTKIIFQERGE